ncbi:MAG: lipid-binding SYLF domain-containing protein [Phycisphaerae bacterium]|jgi:lipid-binding SYLF domain-containing protein
MKSKILAACLCLAIFWAGCAIAPEEPDGKAVLSAEASEAIAVFQEKDPKITRFFENSYGYAVLPKVFKGAFLAGGAYGKGEVYEQNKLVGYCSMSQATLGFSFGGEFFREIVFFKTKNDLDVFKTEEYTFSAQVTGVAVNVGAAAKADYKSGMAVFIATDKGLMVDVSLGGQKFNYLEKSAAEH